MRNVYYKKGSRFCESGYVKSLCRSDINKYRMIDHMRDGILIDVFNFYKPSVVYDGYDVRYNGIDDVIDIDYELHRVSPSGSLYVLNTHERNLIVNSDDSVCVLDDDVSMRNYARLLSGKYGCLTCVGNGVLSLDKFLSYASMHCDVKIYGDFDSVYSSILPKILNERIKLC